MQALQDLPLDVSSSFISRNSLNTILSLPAPFIKMWLLGCHATKLDLSSDVLTDSGFMSLMSELSSATRMRSLALDLSTLTSSQTNMDPTCSFLKDAVSDGNPMCATCQSMIDDVHPLALPAHSAAEPGETAVMLLSRALHRLPELAHLGPLSFLMTTQNVVWLEHLFASTPNLTHVDVRVCAVSGSTAEHPAVPCFALLFLQSFMMLPKLKELRVSSFPGGMFSCMLEVLQKHPSLEKVVIARDCLQGAVPQSMRGTVSLVV